MSENISDYMQAMLLEEVGQDLVPACIEQPLLKAGEVLVKVSCCGVCRTDLHVKDGELLKAKLPLILGHEIVGTVEAVGSEVRNLQIGQRVGIPWLGGTCSECAFCKQGKENLCDRAIFTGYHKDGGYAEYVSADANYCFPLADNLDDLHAAPLLCAGLIGWRSLKLAGSGAKIGLYGFGAAAHIIIQIIRFQKREAYVFTKEGDSEGQAFARELGAKWTGGSNEQAPNELDAAIIFAPVGELIPQALRTLKKGGIVVCAGIHMSDIPSFPYSLLWEERTICSVANLTRQDAWEFLHIASTIPVKTHVQAYSLLNANEALEALRAGKIKGAAVLDMKK